MTSKTAKHSTRHGLKVGDRVIDFRGETTGVVTAIEINRGAGRSDKVTVLVDGDGWKQSNYESVWSKLPKRASKCAEREAFDSPPCGEAAVVKLRADGYVVKLCQHHWSAVEADGGKGAYDFLAHLGPVAQ